MLTPEQLDRKIELQRLKNESQALKNRELELKLQLIECGQLVAEYHKLPPIDRLKQDIMDRVKRDGTITARDVMRLFGRRSVGCKFNSALVKQIFAEIAAAEPDKFALELTNRSVQLKLVAAMRQSNDL